MNCVTSKINPSNASRVENTRRFGRLSPFPRDLSGPRTFAFVLDFPRNIGVTLNLAANWLSAIQSHDNFNV